MAEPFLGEIRIVAFNFAPQGWAMCNGQLLPITQNTALFSLIGTFYGGNGTSNFALPNLMGRVPIHQGAGAGLSNHVIGELLGAEVVTLTESQMPSHSHPVNATANKGNKASPIGNFPASDAAGVTAEYSNTPPTGTMNGNVVSPMGGNQPHENRQPSLVLTFIIALQGIFPARD